MPVVTITGHLGSMGQIARLTAQRLGYDLLEPQLALEASRALNWPEERVREFDQQTEGLGGRFVSLLREFVARPGDTGPTATYPGGAVEEVMMTTYGDMAERGSGDDQRYLRLLREVIHFFAEKGNVVIVGRGGQAILGDRADVIHFRVVCSPEERFRRISVARGLDLDQARQRVAESDRQRAAWHQQYFQMEYQAAEHYHSVVNSGLMPDDVAADLLVQAVKRLSPTA